MRVMAVRQTGRIKTGAKTFENMRNKDLLRRNIHSRQMLGVRKKPDGPIPSPRQPPGGPFGAPGVFVR